MENAPISGVLADRAEWGGIGAATTWGAQVLPSRPPKSRRAASMPGTPLLNSRGPALRRGPLSGLAVLLSAGRDDLAIICAFAYAFKHFLSMAKTSFYIDGFNLYHAIDKLDRPHLKWLNLRALAESFLRPEDEVLEIVYFSAHMVWDQQKLRRHKEYIKALETVGVEPVLSRFLRTDKYCQKNDCYCFFREEKQTDVGFAVRMLTDALSPDGPQRVVLVTADSDQVPTIGAIRGLAPKVGILVASPPGRKEVAGELVRVSPEHREIEPGRLERCLFPRNVRNAKGTVVARCPALYNHPEATA
jgi:hypothetical protein